MWPFWPYMTTGLHIRHSKSQSTVWNEATDGAQRMCDLRQVSSAMNLYSFPFFTWLSTRCKTPWISVRSPHSIAYKKKENPSLYFRFRTNAVVLISGAERVIKENTLASKLQLRLHLRMKSMSYSRPLNTSYPKCLKIEIELVTSIIFTPLRSRLTFESAPK